jgi:hypothetical protein
MPGPESATEKRQSTGLVHRTTEPHHRTVRGEIGGVHQELEQDLLEPLIITHHMSARCADGVDFKLQSVFLEPVGDLVGCFRDRRSAMFTSAISSCMIPASTVARSRMSLTMVRSTEEEVEI